MATVIDAALEKGGNVEELIAKNEKSVDEGRAVPPFDKSATEPQNAYPFETRTLFFFVFFSSFELAGGPLMRGLLSCWRTWPQPAYL